VFVFQEMNSWPPDLLFKSRPEYATDFTEDQEIKKCLCFKK
jgi:hypothetical protein